MPWGRRFARAEPETEVLMAAETVVGQVEATGVAREAETARVTARSRGWRVVRLLSQVLLAANLLAVAVVAEAILNAPKPKPGSPISPEGYAADIALLRDSRERWASASETVHEAADRLAATFVRSSMDSTLRRFLKGSAAATATRRGQIVAYLKQHLFFALQRYLGWSWPDASGFANIATLYVASEEQLRTLVADAASGSGPSDEKPRTLLDVGSGSGTETAKLSAALNIEAEHVACLETSSSMRRALRARGFRAASSADELSRHGASRFSAAALLNVLDRSDDPGQLLDAVVGMLEPGGVLLLATVLPFHAKVHEGRVGSKWARRTARKPRSPLALEAVKQGSFESQVAAFLGAILHCHPRLELVRWTRLPYVSSGDPVKTHYALDMAVMVFRLRRASEGGDPDPATCSALDSVRPRAVHDASGGAPYPAA